MSVNFSGCGFHSVQNLENECGCSFHKYNFCYLIPKYWTININGVGTGPGHVIVNRGKSSKIEMDFRMS